MLFHREPDTTRPRGLDRSNKVPSSLWKSLVAAFLLVVSVAGLVVTVGPPEAAYSNVPTTYSATGTITVAGSGTTTAGLTSSTVTGDATVLFSDLVESIKNGDTTISAGKIVVSAGTSIDVSSGTAVTASRTLTLKSTSDIVMNSGSSLVGGAQPLNIVMWADSDGTSGGAIFTNGTPSGISIQTKGGHLWMGGGSGSELWNGLTVGASVADGNSTATSSGIHLAGTVIETNNGNLSLKGRGGATSVAAAGVTNQNGIRTNGFTTINAGSGTIYMSGSAAGSPSSANGIELSPTAGTFIRSSSSSTEAIVLEGSATNASANDSWGFYSWSTEIQNTGSGTVTIRAGGARNAGLAIAAGGAVLASSGAIVLEGTQAGASFTELLLQGTIGQKAGGVVPTSSANITLIGNTMSLTGTVGSSGTLTIRPRTDSTTIGLGGASGTLQVTSANFTTHLADGFAEIVIGSAAQTGTITTGNLSPRDNTTLRGAALSLGALNASTNTVTLDATGSVTQSGAITAGNLALRQGGTFSLTNVGNNVGTVAAGDGTTAIGSVALVNSQALTLGTVGGLTGIRSAGAIDIQTTTGNITVSQLVTSALGTGDAIKLFARKPGVAGDATGGDIVFSGSGSVQVAAGARGLFYSGSSATSTGLVSATGGTSNSRANVDATTDLSTLSPAVGSTGSYALFRDAGEIIGGDDPAPPDEEGSDSSSGGSESKGPPAIALDFGAKPGRPAEGAPVIVGGTGLPVGGAWSVKVFEPEVILGSGVVPGSGSLSGQFPLPALPGPGSYTIRFQVDLGAGAFLELYRVILVDADGTIADIGTNSVGSSGAAPPEPEKLAYTGLRNTYLMWWSLLGLSIGLLLVVYSVRAVRMVERMAASLEAPRERTPWEILATPIRVPGIDYRPGTSSEAANAQSLSEAIRELDVALSVLVARKFYSVSSRFSPSWR